MNKTGYLASDLAFRLKSQVYLFISFAQKTPGRELIFSIKSTTRSKYDWYFARGIQLYNVLTDSTHTAKIC